MAGQLFAAIHIGSYELDMGIYEISQKNGPVRIDRVAHHLGIGKESYRTGRLGQQLVNDICMGLNGFNQIMKEYQIKNYKAYGTSAMREAENINVVLDQIKVRTGIDVTILSNSEERLMGYQAIAIKGEEFQKILQKGTAIADVSYGSTQLSTFDKDILVTTQKLRLGVLKLSEMALSLNGTTQEKEQVIREMIECELDSYQKMYLKDRDKNREIKNLIAIGEPILYLVRNDATGKGVERISAEKYREFCSRISVMSLKQIEEEFGVTREYAAFLIPTAMIYWKLLDMTGAELIWIPEILLSDGIAAEYARSQNKLPKVRNYDEDILSAARHMAKRYRCSGAHTQQMESWVQPLFDTLKKYHGLESRDRLLLQIAVLIHGCGKFISTINIGDCAYHIIMATEIIGLSHKERRLVATMVKYHDDEFEYGKNDVRSAKLTAMLCLLNALDRSHKQKMADLKFTIKNDELIMTTSYTGDLTLERVALDEKSGFFQEMLGLKPVLKQKRRV